MNAAKKIIFILLIAVIMIGGAGCMGRKSLPEAMVDHISNKYGIQFEYDTPFGGDTKPESRKIKVTTAEYPGCDILVEYKRVDGEEVFTDSFLNVKYFEQTRQLINDTVSEFVSGEFSVLFEPDMYSLYGDDAADMSFSDYIAAPGSPISFLVIVGADTVITDRESFEQAISSAFKDSGMSFFAKLYIDNGVWDFANGDKYDITSYNIDHGYSQVLAFNFDSNSGMSNIRWGD